MAYWQKKNGKLVFVYSKRKPLPRSLTKHLDGEPDHNIDAWVRNYELTHENPGRDLEVTIEDRKLSALVDQYCAHMRGRKKAEPTIEEHRRCLTRYVIPYFLSHKLTDVNTWPSRSFDFHDYMIAGNESAYHIRKSNTALRGFWKYLQFRRHIITPYALNLLDPVTEKTNTPLEKVVTPEKILQFVNQSKIVESNVKLLALCGYFFSLRPQELFALRRSDFVAGSRAQFLEPCKVMKEARLFDKFAVNVTKQRRKDGTIVSPKTATSNGIVACFNRQAAELIITQIRTIGSDDLLFSKYTVDHYYHLWVRHGISGVTLKDLRRSSLYWLGHNTNLSVVALRSHARHASIETTALYMRRPEEVFATSSDLDLEA